jgi:ABC-type maltose transport system permease subunit
MYMYMPITINFVTNFKEILFIASTEAHTTDILKNSLAVALSVVVLVCLLTGRVIIFKSKQIF